MVDALAAAGDARRVQPRQQPLRRRLLIAGRAVDLAGQEQPADPLGLQRRPQFARIDMVVFDGVAGPQ